MLSIFKKLWKPVLPKTPATPVPYLPPSSLNTSPPRVIPKGTIVAPPAIPAAPAPEVPKSPPVVAKTVLKLVTADQMKEIFPSTPLTTLTAFVDPINTYCTEYNITSKDRLAHFLSQVGHESGGFALLRENLNYSADGLRRTFKKYFPTVELATLYARKPRAIASRVYANRMGNGNEASGDGWKHRGFGAIQLTGKSNQTRFANAIGVTVESAIAYLQTPKGAIHGAVWFWEDNGLTPIADQGLDGITLMTKKINGGKNGLADRLAKYKKAVIILR